MEPDPPFARLVTGILREADGVRVEHVDRLSEALAHLASHHIDVVVSDVILPDSAGSDTVRLVRYAAPAVPLIVVSGVDTLAVALRAIRDGADEYVVKGTLSVDSLAWLVRLVLERNRRLAVKEAGLDLLQAVGRTC